MKKFAKLLAMVLAVSMVLTMFVGAYDYKDAASIDEDKADAVKAVYEAGIMMGDDKGNFNPTNALTRDEMAKILYVMTNADQSAKAVYGVLANEFDDADEIPNWSKNFIGYAAATSYLKGDDKNEVNAKDNLTYVEAAIVLLRTLGLEGAYKVGETEYDDFTGPKWYSNALFAADQAGLLAGIDVEDFRAAITREDVAVMINNAFSAIVDDKNNTDPTDDVLGEDIYALATASTGVVINTATEKDDDDNEYDVLVLSNGKKIPQGDIEYADVVGKEISVVFEGTTLLDAVLGESKEVEATLDQLTFNPVTEKKDGRDVPKTSDKHAFQVTELKKDKEVLLKDIFTYDLYIFNGSMAGDKYENTDAVQLPALIAAEMQKQEVTLVINEGSVSVFYARTFFINFDADDMNEDYDAKKGWLGTYTYESDFNGDRKADVIAAEYASLKKGIYAAQIIDNELIIVGATKTVDATKVVATQNTKGEITVKVDGEEAAVVYDAAVEGANKADIFATINKAGLEAFASTDIYRMSGDTLGSVVMYGDWIISAKRASTSTEGDPFYGVVTGITYGKIVDTNDLDRDTSKTDIVEVEVIAVETEDATLEITALRGTFSVAEGTLYQFTTDLEGKITDAIDVTWSNKVLTNVKAGKVTDATFADDAEFIFVNLTDDAKLADITIDGDVITVAGKKVLKNTVKAFWIADADVDVVVVVYDLKAEFGVYGEIK